MSVTKQATVEFRCDECKMWFTLTAAIPMRHASIWVKFCPVCSMFVPSQNIRHIIPEK